jgi:dephospho-CoA kinase
MIVLGLTGSIGMGKSTVSAMFAEGGVPVWDADAAVHNAYEGGGEEEDKVYKQILRLFPEACNAGVNRQKLGEIVFNDAAKLRELERIFGHYLEMDRARFIAKARWLDEAPLVVLDIPLLLENPDLVMHCHYVAVVHCPDEEQRRRVLARPGMTEERFQSIVSKQMPSALKLQSADIRIDTARPMLEVRAQVSEIIDNIADDYWVAKQ